LLLAVFEGDGDLRVLRAASGSHADLTELAPAERARLVHIDNGTARMAFRHPLIRSALVDLSTHEQRRTAHAALADALAAQPERRAWHLAEATVGADDAVAALVEQAAYLVMSRGDAFRAVSALVRAAELSESSRDRARRLAEAAYIGAEASGDLQDARVLLADARRVATDLAASLPAACAAVFLMLNSDGDVGTAHRLLVGAIESGDHRYDATNPALVEALHNLALLCWYGSTPKLWEPFYSAMEKLTPKPPDLLGLLSKTFPDPARTAAGALEEAEKLLHAVADERDSTRIMRAGTASVYIDRLADLRQPSWRLVHEGRSGGAARRHIGALMHLCLDDFLIGQWDEGEELAEEGLGICRGGRFPFFGWYFVYHKAVFAAGRGRSDEANDLADELSAWAVPRGVRAAELWASLPRTLVAIGKGDFEAAFRHASSISPAGTLASHIPHSLWLMFDLVEAALRTGRHADAQAHVIAMAQANVAAISPRMALIYQACAALAANNESSPPLFDAALSNVAGGRWRYDEARVRMAYGEWLRRTKAQLPARAQLAMARESFERMGALPLVDRAVAELRASGERLAYEKEDPRFALTTQEHQIALLAARGLTNKEIAQRLYLSPRTVSTHLYKVFPKLGVATRAALRDALRAQSEGVTSS
ncbi:MAG TPA: LuxR C-terminal-related transcriptional regulator, partial [Acidimicrobiales bacterium]|nr:LuxR C-terminal-related transcriptional regulator [Acidimicrobiales bacterium]